MNPKCDMVRPKVLLLLAVYLLAGCDGEPGRAPGPPSIEAPIRLFPSTPAWARDLIPMSQVDFAMAVFQQGPTADRSAKAEKDAARIADPSTETRRRIEQFFSQIVQPGWHIEGWVCQVGSSSAKSPDVQNGYYYPAEGPPREATFHVLALGFPQTLGTFGVGLVGTNYDKATGP